MLRTDRISWNPKARRFVARTPLGGYGFISEAAVREIVDNDIDVAGARMGKLGDDLKQAALRFKDSGDRDAYNAAVRTWRDRMAAETKAATLGQAASAVGGIDQMGPRENGRCGGLLRVQYGYLSNTAAEFAADPDLVLGLVPGRQGVDQRGPAYAESSRYVYERMKDIGDGEAGLKWCVNVLEETAHHCYAKPGQEPHMSCPGQTKLGPVRYNDVRRICSGGRICKFKCKCHTRRFRTKKAALVVWRETR